ncbi:hypothetical protein NKI77_31835, partial [Mesorhizobium opportunistum]|uniref:hypothetical protein n=1 Tax=Mesorhizobium opportunistum TaxID=593909 RepID=UPI003338C69F
MAQIYKQNLTPAIQPMIVPGRRSSQVREREASVGRYGYKNSQFQLGRVCGTVAQNQNGDGETW